MNMNQINMKADSEFIPVEDALRLLTLTGFDVEVTETRVIARKRSVSGVFMISAGNLVDGRHVREMSNIQ